MKKNLAMIEAHRQKMGFLVGFIIFLFLYLCFCVFWFTSVTYIEKSQIQNLETKNTRVQNVLKSRETFLEHTSEDAKEVVASILEDTYIRTQDGLIVSDFNGRDSILEVLPYGEVMYFEDYIYIHDSYEDDGVVFYTLVRTPGTNFAKVNLIIFLCLVLSGPFLFALLAFIGCRLMHIIYNPIKDIVMNLEDFSANINHEFKTSLSEIISTLELSRITQDYESAIDQSLQSSKRLNYILDSLGILIRFVNSEYRKRKSNITKMIEDSIRGYYKSLQDKNIHIVKKYNPEKKIVRVIDQEPLLLCFDNILKNAIRYSHSGGKIEIELGRSYFSIKDYGVGIDKKNLDKIFDRYFRENYRREGSGIGLSLVKRICDKYNWTILVESEKDSYTKFTVHFQ